MTTASNPYRLTTDEACAWLTQETGTPWTLARMIEGGITPYVWLDYDARYPDLFGDANGGYAAPIFLKAIPRAWLLKQQRGADHDDQGCAQAGRQARATGVPARTARAALSAQGSGKAGAPWLPVKAAVVQESRDGITREQVLTAFGALVKIDLDAALTAVAASLATMARVKGSAKKGKNKTIWNPVTLALGLNDVYRVPVGRLKKHSRRTTSWTTGLPSGSSRCPCSAGKPLLPAVPRRPSTPRCRCRPPTKWPWPRH
ncbi:hypothetical protein LP420_05965 [Massilia sp. B-10]|nr:hypothetical protein LP420_05965 [Massilia sp. B-10]